MDTEVATVLKMRCYKVCSTYLHVFVLIAGVRSLDYCRIQCDDDQGHIGCNADTSFGSHCPDQVERIDVNRYKDTILDAHNIRRNLIASGKVDPFKPAARMGTTVWNDELAELAFLNVKTCIFKHDSCHPIDAFPHPGQNVAATSWSGQTISDVEALERQIDGWFLQYVDAEMTQIQHYGGVIKREPIGHFTILVNQNNTFVGCGAVKYKKKEFITILMACNYAVTNFVSLPIYESAEVPASGCTSGTNPEYESLCSKDEKYSWL